VCSFLRKNIKRAKARKKLNKKKKRKNSKREEKRSKRSTQGTLDSSIVYGAFALSVFLLLPFILVSLPCVSQLVQGTRIGQQLGQVLWIFI
jgi:uncharacterized protein YqhQ